MSLSYRQENQLRRIEADLSRSELQLEAMFSIFGKLYPDQEMPASEQMPPVPASQDRLHRAAAWIVAALSATAMPISLLLTSVAVVAAGRGTRGAGRQARTYRPGRGGTAGRCPR